MALDSVIHKFEVQQHTEHEFTKERHEPVGPEERHRNERAETPLQEKKLGDIGLFSQGKKRLLGNLTATF